MSQFETAQRHLSRALRRLETALERRLSRPAGGGDGIDSRALGEIGAERDELARQFEMLRDQCDRLSAALSEAQQDNRTLREVSGRVAQRLDGSIVELDRLLGS
jgi:ABC-type phosphate transport system auxiliary subunit